MAVFAYTALDRLGKRMSGTVPADSRAAAMDLVVGRGLSPIAVDEQNSARKGANGESAKRSTSTSRSAKNKPGVWRKSLAGEVLRASIKSPMP